MVIAFMLRRYRLISEPMTTGPTFFVHRRFRAGRTSSQHTGCVENASA
jgi:hypothetical protein